MSSPGTLVDDPIAMDLISIISPYPYRRYIQYISANDATTEEDFTRMEISKRYSIDKSRCYKKDGSRNASGLLDLFGSFTNESARVIRKDIVQRVELENGLYASVGQIALGMRKLSIKDWCTEMLDRNHFPDETCIYALSRTFNRHTLVLCRTRYWTTLEATSPMTEDDLFSACNIHLIYLGCSLFGELKPKVVLHQSPLQATNTSDHNYAIPSTSTSSPQGKPANSSTHSEVIDIPNDYWFHPMTRETHPDDNPITPPNMKGGNKM